MISSGIDDGDQVIVSGLQKVQPGAPAKAAVVPAPGEKAPEGAAPAAPEAPAAPAAPQPEAEAAPAA